ncbi:hypothetical protein D3C76_1031400 [compost metagenome]
MRCTAHGVGWVGIIVGLRIEDKDPRIDQRRVVAHRDFDAHIRVAERGVKTGAISANALMVYGLENTNFLPRRPLVAEEPCPRGGTDINVSVLLVVADGIEADISIYVLWPDTNLKAELASVTWLDFACVRKVRPGWP